MPKTARTRPGKKVTQLGNMAIENTDPPVLDADLMSDNEKELFFNVITASISACHSMNPIQQAKNMEAYFSSTARASIFYAGLYVREYRQLQKENFDVE